MVSKTKKHRTAAQKGRTAAKAYSTARKNGNLSSFPEGLKRLALDFMKKNPKAQISSSRTRKNCKTVTGFAGTRRIGRNKKKKQYKCYRKVKRSNWQFQ